MTSTLSSWKLLYPSASGETAKGWTSAQVCESESGKVAGEETGDDDDDDDERVSNSLWQKQKSIIISFQCHPVVGHILVLSCYLFFAPERRKIFSRNRKNIFSRCYVIGSLPPAPAFMRVLEAIKGIGPVPEELPAGAFSPINMTAAVLNK